MALKSGGLGVRQVILIYCTLCTKCIHMSNRPPSNSLWQFMLSTYAKVGVKELCLRAQNEYGIDVLLLLMDAWLKQENRAWPQPSELQAYLGWREQMIIPLRTLRMRLAKDQEPLRSQLLTAELSAEKHGVVLLAQAQANSVDVDKNDFLEQGFVFLTAGANSSSAYVAGVARKEAQSFYALFSEQLKTQ